MKFGKNRHNCYCAFCKSPRRVARKRNINLWNIVASALVAGVLMIVFWQGYDPRVFIFFAFNLAIAEMFLQFRWRLSIPCRACGFDPVLYLKDPERAAERVKLRLDERKQDPGKVLARPLNLPTIAADRAEEIRQLEARKKAPAGSLVSRNV